MHISYFTERPYRYVPNDLVIQNGFFGNPNKYFDPVKGGQLLNEYLDEKLLAEEVKEKRSREKKHKKKEEKRDIE